MFSTMRYELEGVFAVWLREFTIFRREKARVISAMATPLMWLLLFGGGLGATINIEGINYQHFIFPGILCMAVLFSSVFLGLYIVWDKRIDVLKAVLVAPVSRAGIFFGKALGNSTDVMLQATILMAIGLIWIPFHASNFALAWIFLFITAIGMNSVGLFIGAYFDSLESFNVVVSFVVFPLFFLSGALYPIDPKLPVWLNFLVHINPLTYSVDAVRQLLLGVAVFPLWLDLSVISAFAIVMVTLGAASFRRMRQA